jgi:DNA-binding IclR family transcriptional regulator
MGRILAVLQARGRARVYEIVDATGVPPNVAALALRQLAATGHARRAEDEHHVAVWIAVGSGAT